MWEILYRIVLGLEKLEANLHRCVRRLHHLALMFFLKIACIVEIRYIWSRICRESHGNIMLWYADLEDMIAFFLMKGFEVVKWESSDYDVRRDYVELIYGPIIVELHRKWATCNPSTYVRWYIRLD